MNSKKIIVRTQNDYIEMKFLNMNETRSLSVRFMCERAKLRAAESNISLSANDLCWISNEGLDNTLAVDPLPRPLFRDRSRPFSICISNSSFKPGRNN